MKADDKEEFAKIMAALGAAYMTSIPAETIFMYFSALSKYDIKKVRSVLRPLISRCKFVPRISDFIEELEGIPEDKALYAWNLVKHIKEKHGFWKSILFEDAAIGHALAAMGGWICIGNTSEKDFDYLKKDFLSLYRSFSKRNEEPRRLVGYNERYNNDGGYTNDYNKCIVVKNNGASLPEIMEVDISDSFKMIKQNSDIKKLSDSMRVTT